MNEKITSLTLIVSLLNLIGVLILGWLNYKVNRQTKLLRKLKNNFKIILQNTLGFIELEKIYNDELSDFKNTKQKALKDQMRSRLQYRINGDYSGEAKIKNLLDDVENI